MRVSKFRKGSTTFKCSVCTRLTRDTGVQPLGHHICPQCFDLAGIENEISDGHCTADERKAEIDALLAHVVTHRGIPDFTFTV